MLYSDLRLSSSLALLCALVVGCSGIQVEAPPRPGAIHQRSPDEAFDPTGYSALAPQHVDAIFAENAAGLDNCKRRAAGPFVSGVVRLQFVLDERGRTETVFVADSDVGSYKVEDCLLQTARFLEFPVPPDSGRTQFVRSIPINEAARRISLPQPESWGYTALRARRDAFRTCRTRYSYQGPFHLTLYVGGRGRVLSAGFHARNITPEGFAACVVQVAEETEFPGAGDRVVRYRALVELLADD